MRPVTLRAIAVLLTLLLAAAEAAAQRTGSRMGRTAEVGNTDDAELALALIARCVAARRPDLVRRWLAILPGTREELDLINREREDLGLCLEDARTRTRSRRRCVA